MKIDMGEAERIVSEQKESGLGVGEYCIKRGISSGAFYRLRVRVAQASDKFAMVRTDRRVELELSNGVKVKVSPEDLKLVMAALV